MLTISSGPRLMADRVEFEKSSAELPGEGRTYSSKEEGTKIWRNKTLRKYHEPVPKQHKERPERRNPEFDAIEYRSDRSDRSDGFRSLYRNHRALPATDDQKMVSAEDLDKIFLEREPKGFNKLQTSDSYSYIPTVRDVAIQCNRKKSNRHLNTSSDNDSYVRVIKSSNDGFVTAYSDVPQLKTDKPSKRTPVSKHEVWSEDFPPSEVIYSKVDKTKKKPFRGEPDKSDKYSDLSESYPTVIYRTPLNERRSPSGLSHYSKYSGRGSEYSTNTNRTLKNKTKGIGFTFNSGVDGPKVNLPKSSPKLRSRSLNRYEEPTREWNDSFNRSGRKEVKQEVLEETISISNASSDDFEPYHPNRSFDEFLEPKPHFKEVERKRKDVSYVSTLSNQRRLTHENERPIEDDYRRELASNVVIYPTGSDTSYSTLSRFDKKKEPKVTEFIPPPRQAYTLDRRHLKEKQQKTESPSNTKLKDGVNSRLHKSTADLTEYSRRDGRDDTRGGLANAYRNRQEKRTSSLNRMSAIREGRMSPSGHSTPIRYLSHSHLNSAGNSLNSSSESDTLQRQKRHYIHDREPIVMYIPAVSHHNKRAEDEPDRLSGILRPSSRTGSTASSRKYGKKPPKSSASDLTPSKPRDYSSKYSNYGSHRPHNDEELDQVVELKDTKNFGKLKKGKSILSRRHSIPKDTKFPWLQKLKSKVKFRE